MLNGNKVVDVEEKPKNQNPI